MPNIPKESKELPNAQVETCRARSYELVPGLCCLPLLENRSTEIKQSKPGTVYDKKITHNFIPIRLFVKPIGSAICLTPSARLGYS